MPYFELVLPQFEAVWTSTATNPVGMVRWFVAIIFAWSISFMASGLGGFWRRIVLMKKMAWAIDDVFYDLFSYICGLLSGRPILTL